MYTLIVDVECDIIKVREPEFKDCIETYKKIVKRWKHVKFVSIVNQGYLDSEKLEIKFNHKR